MYRINDSEVQDVLLITGQALGLGFIIKASPPRLANTY